MQPINRKAHLLHLDQEQVSSVLSSPPSPRLCSIRVSHRAPDMLDPHILLTLQATLSKSPVRSGSPPSAALPHPIDAPCTAHTEPSSVLQALTIWWVTVEGIL